METNIKQVISKGAQFCFYGRHPDWEKLDGWCRHPPKDKILMTAMKKWDGI